MTFEHNPPRRFDVVVGADGLHSGVRRLTFGDNVSAELSRWIPLGGVGAEGHGP